MIRNLVFVVLVLCFVNLVSSQTPISILQGWEQNYRYGIIPNLMSISTYTDGYRPVALWWTPDQANNQLRVAVMGGQSDYVAVGFNNVSAAMQGGYAVIAMNNSVDLYFLHDYVASEVIKLEDQSNILDASIHQIDGLTFMEFIWDLGKGPVVFDMTKNQNILFASKDGPTLLDVHDYMGVATVNFASPVLDPTMLKPVVYATCGVGNYISPLLEYLGPCTCIGSFLPASNCTQSSHEHSHTFENSDGAEILTMYWTLLGSTLYADVTRPAGNDDHEWAAIGFSTPAGTMFPTDVVISPVKDNKYQPSAYFIPDGARSFSAFTTSQFNLSASIAASAGSYRFFNFSRVLLEGHNPILNTAHVYMIAASSNAELPAQHNSKSSGADILNLATGGVSPKEFYWTPIVTHGLLMWICWALLIPFGFIWARFLKGYPSEKSALWFEGHRTLMTTAFIIVLCAAGYAISLSSTHFDNIHKILGISVICGALYQVSSAVMRPHADPHNPSIQRRFFEWTHHTIGRLSILASWVTIAYGLMLVPGVEMTIVYIHAAIAAIWVLVMFVLEVRKGLAKSHKYESLNRRN
jgi:hypothetical protein